jgi:hypothetical protein
MGASGEHEAESTLTISRHEEAPRVARRFAREVTVDVLDADATETLELLVSELVAATLGPGDDELEMTVVVLPDVVRVELIDTSDLPGAPDTSSVRTMPTEVDRFRAAIFARLADGTGAHRTDHGCRHWLELRRRPRARR